MISENTNTAESNFRDAFERLKTDSPIVLPVNSEVSQNNVAKEAGRVPSALRKSRFKSLVAEIQEYVATHRVERPESERQKLIKQRQKNRSTKERTADLKAQLSACAGLLVDANAQVAILSRRLSDMEVRMNDRNQEASIFPFTVSKPKSSPRDCDSSSC